MLMRVCPGGTEGSGREASLSSSSWCHSAWRCFKLREGGREGGGRERGKERGEGEGRERVHTQLLDT